MKLRRTRGILGGKKKVRFVSDAEAARVDTWNGIKAIVVLIVLIFVGVYLVKGMNFVMGLLD